MPSYDNPYVDGSDADARIANDIERAKYGSTSDVWGLLWHALRALQGAKQMLAAARSCSTCGGVPPASGLPCVCGGTNSREAEVNGLRAQIYDLEKTEREFALLCLRYGDACAQARTAETRAASLEAALEDERGAHAETRKSLESPVWSRLEGIAKGVVDVHDSAWNTLRSERDTALARIALLEKVAAFAQHGSPNGFRCPAWNGMACTCGLDEARKAAGL